MGTCDITVWCGECRAGDWGVGVGGGGEKPMRHGKASQID